MKTKTAANHGRIGTVDKSVKIAAGLFWADYAYLGATVEELESGQGGLDSHGNARW